jgi:hypothetical protein
MSNLDERDDDVASRVDDVLDHQGAELLEETPDAGHATEPDAENCERTRGTASDASPSQNQTQRQYIKEVAANQRHATFEELLVVLLSNL